MNSTGLRIEGVCAIQGKHIEQFQLTVESNLGLHWFYYALCLVKKTRATLSCQPIRCKTKTNLTLVTHVFLRLRSLTCIYFEFSLFFSEIYLYSDIWPVVITLVLVLRHSIEKRSNLTETRKLNVQSFGEETL